ncbi:uncharacterized protein LOC143374297 [Andrena cerasifolii]|uniref:uncharacterized protein LOC143374297 n=1 Tax=Andrena cerasifolii TaxID=2819439 RepID=UPI004037CAD0
MWKVLCLLGVLAGPLKSHHLPLPNIRRMNGRGTQSHLEKVHHSFSVPIWQYLPADDFICEQPGYFPDPQHCQYFYKCTEGKPHHLFRFVYRCEKGRFYSADTNSCMRATESDRACFEKPEAKSMEVQGKQAEPNQQTPDEITVEKTSSQDNLTNEAEEKQTPAQNLAGQSDGSAVNAPTQKPVSLFSIHTPDAIKLPKIELNVSVERGPGFEGIKNTGLKLLKGQLFGDAKEDQDIVPVQYPLPSIPEGQTTFSTIPEGQTTSPTIPEGRTTLPTIPEGPTTLPTIPEGPTTLPTIPEGLTTLPTIPEGRTTLPTIPKGQITLPTIPKGQITLPTIPEGQITLPTIPKGQITLPTIPEGRTTLPTIPEGRTTFPTIPKGQIMLPTIPEMESDEKNAKEDPITVTTISTATLPTISEAEKNHTTAAKVQTGSGQPNTAISTTLHWPELKEPSDNTRQVANQSVCYDGKNSSDCVDEGFYGVPEDCSKFYRCVSFGSHFVKYELQCPFGAIWDDSVKTCNFRAAIKEITCKDKSLPVTTTPPTSTTATTSTTPPVLPDDSDTDCPFDEIPEDRTGIICPSGFRQHPKYCNMFYQCISSDNFEVNFTSLVCPDGMVFNMKLLQCEVNETRRAGCTIFEPTEKQDDSRILIHSNVELCPEEGRSIYGERCSSRYIECLRDENGDLEGYLLTCPHGQLYSRIRDKCRPSSYFHYCSL